MTNENTAASIPEPSSSRRPASLKEVALLGARGGDIDAGLREFLDEFYVADESRRASMLADEPQMLEDERANAYLAAVAEHLSLRYALPRVGWVNEPQRFLHRPYFPAGLESLKATFLKESPTAFRRRLIFVDANPLSRPRQVSRGFGA